MTDQHPYLIQLGDAQTAVVGALIDSLPRDGWTSCTVEYRKAGRVAESQVNLTGTDGVTAVIQSPLLMVTALKCLRELMADQSRGAWLSMTLTVASDGTCLFDYNYDARPTWTVQPTDETYIEDLKTYPRSADPTLVPTRGLTCSAMSVVADAEPPHRSRDSSAGASACGVSVKSIWPPSAVYPSTGRSTYPSPMVSVR